MTEYICPKCGTKLSRWANRCHMCLTEKGSQEIVVKDNYVPAFNGGGIEIVGITDSMIIEIGGIRYQNGVVLCGREGEE